MDRNMVYPGAIPLDTDVLTVQRNIMVALGGLAQATLGSTTIVDGLAITQTTVASMTVNIGPGSITLLSTVDATSFGSLAADTTDPLLKMGVNVAPATPLTLTAPGTGGQSQNYIVQVAFQESDATSVVLPYYNSANPAVPFSGPANAGTPQNTQRLQRVNIQLKAGTPATTGTQTTPAPDAGFTSIYAITVANGQTQITTANLAAGNPNGAALVPGAPFVNTKLPQVRGNNAAVWKLIGGVLNWSLNGAAFTTVGASSFMPRSAFGKLRILGGGGGTGGAAGTGASGGGAAGSYGEAIVAFTAGTPVTVSIGAGGTAGGSTTGDGGTGGNSVFGPITAPGGLGSLHALTGGITVGGLTGGAVTGGAYLSVPGNPGGSAGTIAGAQQPGQGGGTPFAQPGYANINVGADQYGAGPGGCNGAANGNVGGGGVAILEW